MFKSIFLLTFLALMPLWLPMGLESLGVRMSIMPLVASWVQAERPQDDLWPPSGWREAVYLKYNPDVATAIRQGYFRSGYEHYVRHGRQEGRRADFGPHEPAPAPSAPVSAPVVAAAVTDPPPVPAAAPPIQPPPVPVQPAPVQKAEDTPIRPAAPAPTAVASVPAGKGAVTPPPSRPSTTDVSGIRSGVHQGFTRIVLDVSAPVRVGSPVQRGGSSLEIDLPMAAWKTMRQGRLTPQGLSYEVEDLTPHVSRLKLKAATPILLKSSFLLPPENGRGHRVVLDIVPAPGAEKIAVPGRRMH
jgi:hypothetical protein